MDRQQRTAIVAVVWLVLGGRLATASKHMKPGGGGGPSYTRSGTPAVKGTGSAAISAQDVLVIMAEHNKYRARERVPPLRWNSTLAKAAQEYAETRKGDCAQVHSTTPYGENLMQITGEGTWKDTVDIWGDEKKYYHYSSNSCDHGQMCGHYEAVVWKDTTGVGCGRIKCNSGDTMLVCEYWPPGFVDGQRPF